jgi:hypothetical protein
VQIGIAIALEQAAGHAAAPSVGSPSFALINTTFTNDLSPDGMTWAAQRGAFLVDQYGVLIQYIQRQNGGTRLCYYVYSNDSGATWNDNSGISGGEGFLARGAIVYDSTRDCIHELIVTLNPGDGGIIYRRISITRDGSHHITSLARVAGVSLSMDDPSGGAEFPTIIMPDANTLLAAWTATTGSGGEIRCCKCDITSDADAGKTAANWVHIGVNSTTTIGSAPAVGSYTIPFTQASAVLTYFNLIQLAGGDLRWVYHSGAVPGAWRTRRSVKSATNVWNSLSSPVTITNVQRSGTDTGYTLKNQLVSQPSRNSADTVFVGLATWKDNANGDTWGAYAITSADAVTNADVYSAGGAHSYAPTGDCVYDSTSDRVVVSYEKTTTQFSYIVLLKTDLTSAQAETLLSNAAVIDIPLLYPRNSGKLYSFYRKAGSPPQPGYFGTMTWS